MINQINLIAQNYSVAVKNNDLMNRIGEIVASNDVLKDYHEHWNFLKFEKPHYDLMRGGNNGKMYVVLASDLTDNKVYGFATLHGLLDTNEWYIDWLVTDSKYKNKMLSKCLFDKCLKICKEHGGRVCGLKLFDATWGNVNDPYRIFYKLSEGKIVGYSGDNGVLIAV